MTNVDSDHKEDWALKNWCFWTMVLEKTLESSLDCKEIKQSILKDINPEYSQDGLMLKPKLQYFGYLMWRVNSLEKNLMLGKPEGRRRRGWQRMKIVGWHHQLNGYEFEQTPGYNEGQGSLVCCSPWGCKELDTTEWLNNNKKKKTTTSLYRSDASSNTHPIGDNQECLHTLPNVPWSRWESLL